MTRATNRLLVNMALLLGVMAAAPLPAADNTYSAAEQKLFLENHLKNIKHSATLTYDYKKIGSLEEAFEDKVLLAVKRTDGSKGKSVSVDYLSGDKKVDLPEVSDAEGNPVIMYFLEKDIRDMHRRTGGVQNYFQKRIRLALAETAEVHPITIKFHGRDIQGTEIRVEPYLNDPMKAKFAKFEKKTYIFTLSDQIPGGVYQLRTRLDDPRSAGNASQTAETPLVEEVLTFNKLGQ